MQNSGYDFELAPVLEGFQLLCLHKFGVSQLLELPLLFLCHTQLLFFQRLHAGTFDDLAAKHLEDGLNLAVEVEQFSVIHLCRLVLADFLGFE